MNWLLDLLFSVKKEEIEDARCDQSQAADDLVEVSNTNRALVKEYFENKDYIEETVSDVVRDFRR